MSDLQVLKEFLNCPVEGTDEVLERFRGLPGAVSRGDGQERFVYLRGSRENRVLLVAHADTVWHGQPAGENAPEASLKNGVFWSRRADTGLGADDRAGCAMLWLLKDLGHSLLVTDGEESGRQGAGWLMGHNPDIADEINRDHQFVIELDRSNARDFKCYHVGTDQFRTYVARRTGYLESDRTSCTDIGTLCRDICGVNLSVGYHNQHTVKECLVAKEWQDTLDLCRAWLAEPDLPKFRR